MTQAPGTDHPLTDLADLGPGFLRDPYPHYRRMRREHGDAHRVRLANGDEVWLVLGHRACRAALNDPRLVKHAPTAGYRRRIDEHAGEVAAHMLAVDPPHHTRLRKLVSREFTARRISELVPRVQEITDALIDGLLASPGRRADLVSALAFPLPITVICELLGVPRLQQEQFRIWSAEILGSSPEREVGAAQELAAYLGDLVATKREDPGEDLLSALIRTHDDDGDHLTHEELLSMATLLLVAGHETTVNLISNGVLALLRHPDQWAALRADPEGLIDGAVEETLRWDPPVERATLRFTVEPAHIGRATIPPGEVVMVCLASAGRDPEQTPHADTFDIRRPPAAHLSFGHGIHFCLGAPLARIEARAAVRALLDHCPDLALDADPAELPWRRSMIVRGPEELPIRF